MRLPIGHYRRLIDKAFYSLVVNFVHRLQGMSSLYRLTPVITTFSSPTSMEDRRSMLREHYYRIRTSQAVILFIGLGRDRQPMTRWNILGEPMRADCVMDVNDKWLRFQRLKCIQQSDNNPSTLNGNDRPWQLPTAPAVCRRQLSAGTL